MTPQSVMAKEAIFLIGKNAVEVPRRVESK